MMKWEDETLAGALVWIVCCLNQSAPFMYAALISVTLLSIITPFLRDLSVHGKTRRFVTTVVKQEQKPSRVGGGASWVRRFAQEWEVPKSWFRHFYMIGLASLALSCWTRSSSSRYHHQTWLLPCLLATHLVRRLYECICVHQWKASSKMHVMGYLAGMAHYVWLPFAFGFVRLSCVNWSQWSTICSGDAMAIQFNKPRWVLSWVRYLVLLIALWAQYQQHRHHVLLANLRTNNTLIERKSTYRVPTGGWFQFVSCPHYLAEIILYCCCPILIHLEESSRSLCYFLQSLLVLIFVVLNLAVSAKRTHRWYYENTADYGKLRRKALIPFLF